MERSPLKLPKCHELAVSPRETFVAVVSREVVVARLRSGERCFASKVLKDPSHVAFDPGETRIAVKNTSGDLAVLDAADGAVRARHKARGYDEGAPVHFSPCGEFLVDASWSGAVRVRRASDLAVVEEFAHPGEMVTDVSRSADGRTWLFAHQPKATRDDEPPPDAYLTVWDWPLRQPARKLEPGFSRLGAASLSPCGRWIATVASPGFLPEGGFAPDELRICDPAGQARWSAPVAYAGTQYRARWSADARLIGTTDASGILVFEAEGLIPHRSFAAEFPSDIAFLDAGTSAVVGSWAKAWVEAL